MYKGRSRINSKAFKYLLTVKIANVAYRFG